MATIEERAKAIAEKWKKDIIHGSEDISFNHLEYVAKQAATEQRDIDIKAAEDWFCFHECKHTGCVDDKTCGVLEGLRNAMKGGSNGNM